MKHSFLLMMTAVVIAVSVGLFFEGFSNDVDFVESDFDHRLYLVRNLPDKSNAAKLLSLIRYQLVRFVKYLEMKYPNDPRIRRLAKNFNPDEISESSPDSKYT